jgi:uncharacterized protein YbjT (DUF2867 family)
MKYLIDLPDPFASKKEWQQFLTSLDKLPADDPHVRAAREAAEQVLAELGHATSASDRLSPSELASLRRKANEALESSLKAFGDVKPK